MGELETTTSLIAKRLPQILVSLAEAAAVIVIGIAIIWLGRKLIGAAIRRHDRKTGDDLSSQAQSGRRTARTIFISLFNYLMYFLIILLVLATLGVDVAGMLTVAGVGGVAVGFGCQTLVKDFISGLFLLLDGYVKVGDVVAINGVSGKVETVALRTTTVRCSNGNLQVIPNGDIRAVTNMTRDYRCALVDITVAHGQNYSHALEVLKQAMAEYDIASDLIDEPPTVCGYISSDARAATVRIECRCNVRECWEIERHIRLACLEAMSRAGIKP